MARATSDSFICELPLRATPADERELLIRLDCARMVYNACLGASLRRLSQVRQSPAYKAACRRPKGKARTTAFAEVHQTYGFREYDLHAWAKQFGQTWLAQNRLDSLTIQKIATRAFLAAQQYAFGKRGRPRFKGKGQFDSVEGKTNTSGIRWQAETQTVVWVGLTLPAILPPDDKVIAHGLSCKTKFVRIVRRKLGQHTRFYVQLVCAGRPYQKPQHTLGNGVVGLDLGPSHIAIVTETSATLEKFGAALEPKQKAMRKLQRKLDRQRRANNPANFNPDGTIKLGVKLAWHHSQRYVYTRAQLADLQRQQAAHRKSLHNRLVKGILALGNTIHLEKISYRSFQRNYGRSVGFRGPGTLVARLRSKAGKAGAEVNEFETRTTRLSQVCLCGAIVKKPLSLRWHACDCGVGPVQRDVFSAWLARFVESNRLDVGRAQAAWPGADSFLRAASSQIEPAMGQGDFPNRLLDGQSRSPVHSALSVSDACHIAPVGLHRCGAISPVTRKLAAQPEPPGFSPGV